MAFEPSPSLHALLLLSDSALPLGSFAFSSGLESFLAHHKPQQQQQFPAASSAPAKLAAFSLFLADSLRNIASTSLPYVFAAYRDATQLCELDNDFDASTPCTVARRASIAQGRALIAIWDRALAVPALASSSSAAAATSGAAIAAEALAGFSGMVKTGWASQQNDDGFGLPLNAHFAPIFGAVCCALGLGEYEAAYLFLLNHAKAVLSAAVRASVMGPYQSQAILAGLELRERIKVCISMEKGREAADALVTVPTMDLWMGRHELLYSRIFNS